MKKADAEPERVQISEPSAAWALAPALRCEGGHNSVTLGSGTTLEGLTTCHLELLYSGRLVVVSPLYAPLSSPLSSERRPITIVMACHRRRVALFKYALPHVAPLSSECRPITIIMA